MKYLTAVVIVPVLFLFVAAALLSAAALICTAVAAGMVWRSACALGGAVLRLAGARQ